MTVEQLQIKLKRWEKTFPRAVNRAVRTLLAKIRLEAMQEYSGGTLNVKTGKTKSAVRYELDKKNMGGRVLVTEPRAFIAVFHETKNRPNIKSPRRPIWEPLQDKYTPEVSNKILAEIMGEYKRA